MQGKNNSLCKQYFIFGTCGCQTHTGVKTDVECLGPAAVYRALLFYVDSTLVQFTSAVLSYLELKGTAAVDVVFMSL